MAVLDTVVRPTSGDGTGDYRRVIALSLVVIFVIVALLVVQACLRRRRRKRAARIARDRDRFDLRSWRMSITSALSSIASSSRSSAASSTSFTPSDAMSSWSEQSLQSISQQPVKPHLAATSTHRFSRRLPRRSWRPLRLSDLRISSADVCQGDMCPICLHELRSRCSQTPCKHQFHTRCLRAWLSKITDWACPLCFQKISQHP